MLKLIPLPQKIKLVALLFAMAMVNDISAQITKEDSLYQIFEASPDDSTKLKILFQLARTNDLSYIEKSVKYYLKTLDYVNDKYNRAAILDTIGLYSWQLGNFNEAFKYFSESLSLFEELNDSLWLGKLNNNMAVVNYGLGNRNEALEYYQKGLIIREATNDKKGLSNIYNNIGIIYQDWGLYSDAFKWHNSALQLATEINDVGAIAYSYSNIGNYHENLKNYEEALKNYLLGYNLILEKFKDNQSNSFFSTNIGRVYGKMIKPDSALFYYQKGLDYAYEINNKNRIAIAQYFLGKTYLELNKVDIASRYINESYDLSVQKKYTDLKKDNLFILAAIEEKKGNVSKAFDYFKSAVALKDSLFNNNEIAKFTDLQIKYNIEKQERENLLLRKDNEIQKVTIKQQKIVSRQLIAGGVLILLVLAFIARSRISFKKLSLKLEKSEKELQIANANKDKFFTIIAHDLKSPFNGLLGLTEILAEEFDELPPETIKKMIFAIKDSSSKVYELLVSLLQWAQIQTNKIEFKYKNINLFLKCKQITELFETNAKNKNILLNNKINKNTIVYADRNALETVLRNMVSNAVKFTKPGGEVTIESESDHNKTTVSVTDTGIGMSEETIDQLFRIDVNITTIGTNNESGTGLGLIISKELIEKHGGSIIVESKLGVGSKFIFTLPNKQIG